MIEFPQELRCFLTAGYKPTITTGKRYLGGVDKKDRFDEISASLALLSYGDRARFKDFYVNTLGNGALSFKITLPMWGNNHTLKVKIVNDVSEAFIGKSRENTSVQLSLVIIEEI